MSDLVPKHITKEDIFASINYNIHLEYGIGNDDDIDHIFTLQGLDEDMLVKILKEPRNAILKQYEKLLEMDEVKLEFEENALRAIAKKALEKDTGARALRAILEEYMLDIMYEIPKDDSIGEVIITKEYIEHTGGPKILLRGQEPLLLQ